MIDGFGLARLASEAKPRRSYRDEAELVAQVGAKALGSGAGRGARVAAALQLLPLEDRKLILTALDEMSRPMDAREIEKALMLTDLGMKDRKRVVAALRPYRIVMLVPR